MDLTNLRREYAKAGLSEDDLNADPFLQFGKWFDEINRPETLDANAMCLATVGADGQPHQRTVLLKGVEDEGFIFFTNYDSSKGTDIRNNAQVSLIFSWHALDRQVIVQGQAKKLDDAANDAYFQSRPRGSQIAASISEQSEPIDGRGDLQARYEALEVSLQGSDHVPRPNNWGGYHVRAEQIEFWQGRTNRLHDRLVYRKSDAHGTGWQVIRLQP